MASHRSSSIRTGLPLTSLTQRGAARRGRAFAHGDPGVARSQAMTADDLQPCVLCRRTHDVAQRARSPGVSGLPRAVCAATAALSRRVYRSRSARSRCALRLRARVAGGPPDQLTPVAQSWPKRPRSDPAIIGDGCRQPFRKCGDSGRCVPNVAARRARRRGLLIRSSPGEGIAAEQGFPCSRSRRGHRRAGAI